ncbi:MAG TPA: NAD(P)/FAD-dependent oxidoreductase, partial [Gemmatimonadales bacterium]|nr:NAD(P)/FAD-dependent oxidoreductase [Gemmatimonadales bacterium]
EVAASDLDVTHIVSPVRKLVRRGVLVTGDVEAVDLATRTVRVRPAGGSHPHELRYDHLVLALGSVTNFFGLPGVEARALTMKSLSDAIELRSRLIALLEEADFEAAAGHRRPISVLVAGGGFAGVETIGAINDFVRESLRFYPHLSAADLRFVLVHPGDVILPELSPSLGRYAAAELGKRGVEVRLGVGVSSADDAGVRLSDGGIVPARLLVWTAGTSPNALLAGLPCARERGRIAAGATLEVPGWPGVWALGDCAHVPDPRTGKPYPPTAQHAIRQGRILAENIAARIRGGPCREFVFDTLGQLAAIGRRTGVAQILGLRFSGFVAWALWRAIYLSKLPRFERKVRVALDWTLDLVFSKDLVQLQSPRVPALSQPDEVPARVAASR